MARYFAFLRAINVGGRNITMEALREHFAALKLIDVETFIASGNVIFSAKAQDEGRLAKRIEAQLVKELGYEVPVMLRSLDELKAITTHEPFSAKRIAAAGALNVALLASPLAEADITTVATFVSDIDDFHVHGREVYWLCKIKQSESKFSNAVFERKLKRSATWRGINTMQRMVAKYDA